MSIPLVKKLDLDSVNTTIIAIKRLLQQAGVSESGNTIINNNSDGSVPLGTWASFEKDYAPNPEWLEAGTDFDANTYPALAMYLGGTTVPERFDHSRLGEYENITSTMTATSSTNKYTALYDGFITIEARDRRGGVVAVNINGVEFRLDYDGQDASASTTTIPLKKGDQIYGSQNPVDIINAQVRYYKHPLFIKATPTSSDSDYEGTLNAIRTYVENKFGWRKIADRTGSSSNWSEPVDIPESATEIMVNGQNNADWESTTDGMNSLMIIPTAILTETAKPYTPSEPSSWGYSNCTIRVKLSKTQILWAYTNNNSGVTNRKVSIWYR